MLVEAESSQIPQSVVIHGARALETEYPALFVSDVRHYEAAVCEDKEAILSKIADIEELCEHRRIVIFGAGGLSRNVWILLTCREDVDEDKAGVAGVCAYV